MFRTSSCCIKRWFFNGSLLNSLFNGDLTCRGGNVCRSRCALYIGSSIHLWRFVKNFRFAPSLSPILSRRWLNNDLIGLEASFSAKDDVSPSTPVLVFILPSSNLSLGKHTLSRLGTNFHIPEACYNADSLF